jgi:peptide/nickel transport system substrate-binding protein
VSLKKKIISGIILIFLTLSVLAPAFKVQPVKAEPGIITVPDDYTTIQQAINAAKTGDTIYVRAGTYYENVIVNQSVSLIGENRKTTIIDNGNGTIGIVLSVYQDYVNITGFTIRNAIWGITLNNADHCNISNNEIINNGGVGIHLYNSSNYNVISGNIIKENFNISIALISSNANRISENNITDSVYEFGVALVWSSANNTIYHNNFVNNFQHVYIDTPGYTNFWDDGYPSGGNYWSDYNGTDSSSGPYQNETGCDGIGDTLYSIDEENADQYPLMDPWIISPPDPSHMIVGYQNLLAGTLDPARCYDTASGELILNVYETLIFFDEEKTNQFVPRLATGWDISEDGLTYTFTIRQGVKFHNNETLTTEDVEYSFERILVIEDELAWMFYEPLFDTFGSRGDEGHFNITGQQLDDAVTRNETTVTLHLAKPYPPMMQILSQTWSSILCKKWCIEIGDWPGTWNNWTLYNKPYRTAIENQTTEPPGPHINAMCGTGPFMLDYYQKRSEWSIIKFDGYWGGWPAPGSGGFLQRVTAKTISNWEVRKYMFLEGQLDYVSVPRVSIDEVLGQPGVRCIYPLEDLICAAMFFTFNVSTSSPYLGVPGGLPKGTFNESGIPPDFFSDINVRKGFAYAFNYSKLIEEVLRGEAYQPATPIIPGLPFYNPAQEKYSINLDKAMDYFVAAWDGRVWDNGFNFTICYNEESPIQQKACEIIKANVESLNSKFHVQIQSIPYNNYLDSTLNHEQPIFMYGWLADFADPHNFVYGFMYSDGEFAKRQVYSNEMIDNLMRAGIGTMNETVRRQVYYEIQMVYHEDCPSVPLYQSIGRRFERDWVRGWYYNPLLWSMNYFYVQWKGSIPTSTRYSWPMFHHDLTHTGYTESPAPNTNQTQWKYETGYSISSSPAVADGRVYIGSAESPSKVYCLDAYTGAQIWNYTVSVHSVFSIPAVADGNVYVGANDGNVYCLDALT